MLVLVLDDVGLRATRLLRVRHRDAERSTASPNAAFASRTFTPPRCARRRALPVDRPQPSPQRHGPRRRPRGRLSRAIGVASRRRTASSRRFCARRAMRRTRLASGTSHPTTKRTWRRSRASWPLGRGFDRWYGFHGGETHQFVPKLYHDNHSIRPPASPEDGYHFVADLADRAIEFIGDLRAVDAERAVLLLFRNGRMPLAAPCAAGMDREVQGPLRHGLGRVARGDVCRASSRRAYCRQAPS